ncbi:MAG TPA: hypothetical protein VLH94_01865 [Spirochaetia bacterium]|nr:hypothetical protein [Spirochaetia bacterium]
MKTVIGIILWIAMVVLIILGVVHFFTDFNSAKTVDIGPHEISQASPLNYLNLPDDANITIRSDDFFHLVGQNSKLRYYSEFIPPPPGENSFYFVLKNPPSGNYQIFGYSDVSLYSETPAKIEIENYMLKKIVYSTVTLFFAVVIFFFGTDIIMKYII